MPARNEEFDEQSEALTEILESEPARAGSTPPMTPEQALPEEPAGDESLEDDLEAAPRAEDSEAPMEESGPEGDGENARRIA